MSQDNKWWKPVLIMFLVVVVLGVSCYFAGYWECRHKYKTELGQIEAQVAALEHERDSLANLVIVLDDSITVLTDSLANQKEKIIYIKVNNNEKVDSIRNLPLDSAVEFLARELSKEADSKR